MFCQQCEQTEGGKGCTTIGVCGKTPEVAHFQDALVHALKGLSVAATLARGVGVVDSEVDRFLLRAMFSTLTNVNFDGAYFERTVTETLSRRNALLEAYKSACKEKGVAPSILPSVATWAPVGSGSAALEAAGVSVGILERRAAVGEEIGCLQELVMNGIKGTAAYACHAMEAGVEDESIYATLHETLAMLGRGEADAGKLVAAAMAVGACNVTVMKALDSAHVARFGAPVPRNVNTSPQEGKCILISGHDLVDIEYLLKAVEASGHDIKVYTHGEMLPAHGYPKLAAHKALAGHYGGPWQLQKVEYAAFPGPIVQSTNCLVEPRQSYRGRLFTTNSTGWPGVEHLGPEKDFSPVIRAALASPGFTASKPPKFVTTGFGHAAVLGVAPAVIDAVKAGQISRFVLIGGCDGAESERSYYTRLAMNLPDSAVILTLGCGKFRVLGKKDYGNVPGTGIPRVLDLGQCNDSYSAVVIASALAQAFGTDINGLPLSIVLSWFEQKAVAVLLSLLSLGVKNIRIGPALPAFITPSTLGFLQDKFGIMLIKSDSADGDVAAVMKGAASATA